MRGFGAFAAARMMSPMITAKPLLTSTIGGPDFVGCVSRRGRTLHDQPNATIAIDHRRIDFLSAMRAVVAHQIGRA
jgi:hypothetical protein